MNANLTFVQFMYNRLQGEMFRYIENKTFQRLPAEVSVEEYYHVANDKETLSRPAIVEAILHRTNSLESLKAYFSILTHLNIYDPRLRHINDALRRYIYEADPEHPIFGSGELDDGEYTDHEDDLTEEELEDFLHLGEQ